MCVRGPHFQWIGSAAWTAWIPSFMLVQTSPETGINPCATPGEFYAAYGQFILQDALRAEPVEKHEGRLFGVWLIRLLLSAASFAEEGSPGRYFLTHHELHTNNVLVSETGEIVGVLDWDSANFVPEEHFASQALGFYKEMSGDNPKQAALFEAYNRALRGAERGTQPLPSGRSLADLHGLTITQMLHRIDITVGGDPIFYGLDWFWEMFCVHLLGTRDWQKVKESPIFQEWFLALAQNP